MMPNGAGVGAALTAFFDKLYDEHRQALHAYFVGRTGDGEAALDLLQEVFLRAWRQCALLAAMPPAQHRYWLFAVARNLATDHLRRRATRANATAQLQQEAMVTATFAPSPVSALEQDEQMRLLDQAIQRLPEQLRLVLAMQVLGELNSGEIGALLDLPAGTVRYQLSLARRRLAEMLRLLDRCQSEPAAVLERSE